MQTRFAAAINCMDGRVQLPVIQWVKDRYRVDYVDMITECGPDKVVAFGQGAELGSIRSRLLISMQKHGADTLVIAGHADCAANTVNQEAHYVHLRRAVEVAWGWNLPLKEITGIWLDQDWQVSVVSVRTSQKLGGRVFQA
jgi:hypothetical protein